ncbi:hypothetical protein JDV02_010571 [Purpureocillium takamizusanense]|uniref:Uncharacterized protein n=1 Tax=Purpureocillium takamizusanense TaxID=2060973 RepID=A0A9Q8QQW5_9HYPO|nr:uncharacterized protein JDV02_010571 [Purpureocillium takamizusanense]UNI24853.1 hypothetical protein JDV02_010571 [Purpureocillium takamizusanense]
MNEDGVEYSDSSESELGYEYDLESEEAESQQPEPPKKWATQSESGTACAMARPSPKPKVRTKDHHIAALRAETRRRIRELIVRLMGATLTLETAATTGAADGVALKIEALECLVQAETLLGDHETQAQE